VLTLESVSKQYRAGNFGVRDISLTIRGGVVGLLGANGAGKTTLMQMIATIMRPTGGRILFRAHCPAWLDRRNGTRNTHRNEIALPR
jgi:ABC-type multidrug transport system ATPase subunit